jgi:hypothetical protein
MNHCGLCGAKEGRPHHDSKRMKDMPVKLHRFMGDAVKKKGCLPMRTAKIVCTLCRDGLYAMRRAGMPVGLDWGNLR